MAGSDVEAFSSLHLGAMGAANKSQQKGRWRREVEKWNCSNGEDDKEEKKTFF
jgi:hypothetical protein